MIFAVDFDGTLSLGETFPDVGSPNIFLIRWLRKRQKSGDQVILWTCRTGNPLIDAVNFCVRYGFIPNKVNENTDEMIKKFGNDTRKVYADYYIDDKNVFTICDKVITLSSIDGGRYEKKL